MWRLDRAALYGAMTGFAVGGYHFLEDRGLDTAGVVFQGHMARIAGTVAGLAC